MNNPYFFGVTEEYNKENTWIVKDETLMEGGVPEFREVSVIKRRTIKRIF